MNSHDTIEPACTSAKPLRRRPHPSSPLLRVIAKKGTHPGYAHRIKRWHKYREGMSLLHCRETRDLDHLDVLYYEAHGLMTLRPMTQEELREVLRRWDDRFPTRPAPSSDAAANTKRFADTTARDRTKVETNKPATRHCESRKPSLDRFARFVPSDLLDRSGEVFYSGRAAFSRPSHVYLLGYNPGSDPLDPRLPSIGRSIDIMRRKPERFSLYYQTWEEGRTAAMQNRMRHLFQRTGLSPCLTPASNCVFARSRGAQDLSDRRQLEEACWPFHAAVISELGVRIILCLGKDALSAVSRKLGSCRQIDEFVEANNRGWRNQVLQTESGIIAIGLTHPSRAAWDRPKTDPSPLVKRTLESLTVPGTTSP